MPRAYYTLPISDALRLLGLPPESEAPMVIVNQTLSTHVRVYFNHIDLPESTGTGDDYVYEVSPVWERDEQGRVVWKLL